VVGSNSVPLAPVAPLVLELPAGGRVIAPLRQKPGHSVQEVETPPDLWAAICRRFGTPIIDLAALPINTKCRYFISPETNALQADWCSLLGKNLGWLNPPYADIRPWLQRAAAAGEAGVQLLVLTPASVGAGWFSDWVHNRALVLALQPRVTFVGHSSPYPKDLLLCCYGYAPGFDVWRWK
jgi:phage N-6-adenine-methyltransferase